MGKSLQGPREHLTFTKPLEDLHGRPSWEEGGAVERQESIQPSDGQMFLCIRITGGPSTQMTGPLHPQRHGCISSGIKTYESASQHVPMKIQTYSLMGSHTPDRLPLDHSSLICLVNPIQGHLHLDLPTDRRSFAQISKGLRLGFP